MQERRPVVERVTVVVPTLGRALLEGCLEAIASGTAWPAELVVVHQTHRGDNADVAGWIDDLRAAGLRTTYVRSDQRGAAAARNRGFERATTAYIAATDDDCLPASDWLERMVARLDEDPGAIVSGGVLPEGTGPALSTITAKQPRVYDKPQLDGDVLFSNNFGFARDVLDRIGPMEEHPVLLTGAEDGDWGHRALRAGVRIRYAPDVVVHHVAWRDAVQRAATYRGYARGQGAFYGLHLRRGDRYLGVRLVYDLARGAWMLVRGAATREDELRARGWGYVRELVPGAIAGWRART